MNLQKVLFITSYLVGTALSATLYEGSPCLRHDNIPGVCKAAEKCEWILKNNIPPAILARCSYDQEVIFICCGDEMPDRSLINGDCEKFVFDEGVRNWCSNGTNRETSPKPVRKVGKRAQEECQKLVEGKTVLLTYNIFGGDVVTAGDYPHMAAIGFASEEVERKYIFRCGGSLISPRFVLTAAHCTKPDMPQPVIVRLGTVDLQKPLDTSNGITQDIGIAKVIRHPDYRPYQLYNDIALLKLSNFADISDSYVYPVCLNTKKDFPLPSSSVDVIGWGETETVGDTSQLLLKANLTVVDPTECQKKYESHDIRGLTGGIAESQLCAWDPDFKRDSCKGDSGGPLHAKNERIDYVVGLVSFGNGCAAKDPAVYTRVSHYIGWIESVVWPDLN
ncbi:serine protease persephone-like isoform X1 [Culicoides brevitarsis]|uniref:serine protease persephone-like isoform X1 n=1 Tax=Culicoides brevitarsis TaxID=469753 RepID=UPI00307B1EB7